MLKGQAENNGLDQEIGAAILGADGLKNLGDDRFILKTEFATEGEGEHAADQMTQEFVLTMLEQIRAESGSAGEGNATGEFAGGIDRTAGFSRAIAADGVEVFKTETERVNLVMAGGAGLAAAMGGEFFAKRFAA
ncbi:MAG TPA: hypothetical protein VD994_01365, partial [Prosthecobacter sp.]|nr:hypothetical protein [Prosthecobacter sp.]